jgi:hypothetical protein
MRDFVAARILGSNDRCVGMPISASKFAKMEYLGHSPLT